MSATGDTAPLKDSLDVVLFSVGGRRVGIEARGVLNLRPAPTGQTGEAQLARLGAQLGLDGVASIASYQVLTLKGPEGPEANKELLIEGPVDLVGLPVDIIHPLPPLLAARTRLNGLRALALPRDDHQVVLLFAL